MCVDPIPLTVVGGFLGAGKSTLLNRVLTDTHGQRVTVLVNDFGRLNIDARLIAGREGEVIALSNGCACCSIAGDLTAALIRILTRTPLPDWILIEASGVSDPWRIAQVARVDTHLSLEGVVVVVDAGGLVDLLADPRLKDTVERQLRAADLVLLNKRDLVSEEGLADARRWVESRAPATPMAATTQADVPLRLLTELCATQGPAPSSTGRPVATDHSEQFGSLSIVHAEPFHAVRLRAILKTIPAGVLRVKGLVRTDEAAAAVLQFSGKHGSLRPVNTTIGRSEIVAVGWPSTGGLTRLERMLRQALIAV